MLLVVADTDLTFGSNLFRRWLMSQLQADRFAAVGKSGYLTRSNRTASTINSKSVDHIDRGPNRRLGNRLSGDDELYAALSTELLGLEPDYGAGITACCGGLE
jgi:hypothetical protein